MKKGVIFPLFISASLVSSLFFYFQSLEKERLSSAKFYQTRIVEVVDGDTVMTQEGFKVRYIGINAPEFGEPGYQEAKALNQKLVEGKMVNLEFDLQKKDQYQRILAYVWVKDNLVQEEILRKGLALTYTLPPNLKYQERLLKAQQFAKDNCLGLWETFCKMAKEEKDKCVKISKINYQAPGPDNQNLNGEWIELKNVCEISVDLSGWQIRDRTSVNRYYFKNFVLKPLAKVKIYSGCGKDTDKELYWQCPPRKYAIWNNNGDTAYLINSKGRIIDVLSY